MVGAFYCSSNFTELHGVTTAQKLFLSDSIQIHFCMPESSILEYFLMAIRSNSQRCVRSNKIFLIFILIIFIKDNLK